MSSLDADAASPETAETVLVVECEILVRMTISAYLRHCGYKVIETVSADEAMLVLQSADVKVDIVFSVVEMPGSMDGFSLARWVRSNRPDLDVILVSSPKHAAEKAHQLCEAGPELAKPYEPQVVVDRIKRLLAEKASRKS